MKINSNLFDKIISVENLFSAWDSFESDKRYKPDVLRFESSLESNLFRLHRQLKSQSYRHGAYTSFFIQDPKQRHIHKATVQDRVLHHAIFNALNPVFEPTFIATSFSCRVNKGTHKGVEALSGMLRRISKNGTAPCFALKCDIQKFFFRIDHSILISLLGCRIQDEKTMWLLREVIESFTYNDPGLKRKGLPIAT